MTQNNDLILVTGATGTVGTNVCENLVKAGVAVRAAYNSPKGKEKLEKLGVAETIQLDIADRASLDAAFSGVTKAFILVPVHPNMLELGCQTIDAAKRANIEYIVRSSGMGAAPDATILLNWHAQTDDYLKESGIPYTLIRPNSFMQNFITFNGYEIKTQNSIYLPLGNGKVSWIDVRDIATFAAQCFIESGHIGKTYTLTGPEALSIEECATLLSAGIGRVITYYDIPEETARAGMLGVGMPEISADAILGLYASYKAGSASEVSPQFEEVTGQKLISFAQFVEDYKAAFAA
ncbi:SDR family oxidoreductase [Kamptonema animale CS-326]|jgi:uncharacterized protein YbjT (DUF2867 family)|uniref:SDR family oxidoreductase n=1 Tax=Kamptonema animale TaxID=92934 RepID=UPI0023312AF7|nr:SDR family oxidoreductase [Kamptonema animale]MDB9513814.1 SDR family oxidoreductase [Kamptonema animale CS-326]